MPDRRPADDVEDVAIDWAMRAERGLTADEQDDLDGWLEQDSRRLGAFVRAQAAWIHAERASALGAMRGGEEDLPDADDSADIRLAIASEERPRMLSRRLVLGGGGALAASAAAAYLLGAARYRTLESGIGEIRHIALQGGTMLTLDTDTRVDVTTSGADRKLGLVRGKLFLEVGRTLDAPFVVKAGDLVMETVRGAFGVEALLDTPITALVTRGRLVLSQRQGLFADRAMRTLGPEQQLTLARDAQLSEASVRPFTRAERERLLAWRAGMLSFGGEPLADAVRAFARYSAATIVVTDPQLAQQRVTGLFKASDPEGFAQAVAASFGGVVSIQGDMIRIAAAEKSSSG